MVPRTTKGRGFKGAAAYYLHDKGKDTAERVRFTHTLNTVSNDPHRAINEMCWTANHGVPLILAHFATVAAPSIHAGFRPMLIEISL